MLFDLAQRGEIHLQQHGNNHDPDQQPHGQIDLSNFHPPNGLKDARRDLTQSDADENAQQYPDGQEALEDIHAGRSRCVTGSVSFCTHATDSLLTNTAQLALQRQTIQALQRQGQEQLDPSVQDSCGILERLELLFFRTLDSSGISDTPVG